MKKIDTTKLTIQQKQIICMCINRKGGGGHPVAEVTNLEYFDTDYAVACIDKATVFLNVEGLAIARHTVDVLTGEALPNAVAEELEDRLNDLLGD